MPLEVMNAGHRILLVEDNDLDAEKVMRAFARLGVSHSVVRARNGLEALDRLREPAGHSLLALPFVVLLDLNMPRMNGFEFLEELRACEEFGKTPVFVLTTSGRHTDVAAAHRHHINGYMVKPATVAEMIETLKAATGFWDLCHLPRNAA